MALLVVTVRPGAKRPGLRVDGAAVEVRVAAPPRDGQANEAVRRALAQALGVPLRAVTLARGGAAKHKAFEIAGLERPAIFARLQAAAGAVGAAASSKDE